MYTRRNVIKLLGQVTAVPLFQPLFAQPGFAADGGTELVLLGTQGGPNFTSERREAGSALIVGGRPYLIDAGYGVLGRIAESGISFLDIPEIFLTHLHDDHVADLPALIGHQWTQGRIAPTRIWGPHGTRAMVEAALAFNQANTEIRMVDEGRVVDPRQLFSGHDVALEAAGPLIVMEDDRIRVTATSNTHYPPEGMAAMPHRSQSLRFDAADRSVVFSGDTAYSEQLVSLARDADVLVCEAMQVEIMQQLFQEMRASGKYQDNPDGILHHIISTHTPLADAGRMAQEAGVGLLVLNHLIPGALRDVDDSSYIDAIRPHFGGRIIVGRDLQRI